MLGNDPWSAVASVTRAEPQRGELHARRADRPCVVVAIDRLTLATEPRSSRGPRTPDGPPQRPSPLESPRNDRRSTSCRPLPVVAYRQTARNQENSICSQKASSMNPEVGGADIPRMQKISINVSPSVGSRVRKIAYETGISKSSIVEISLALLFSKTTDANIGKYLRDRGASLRRSPPT